MGHPPLGHKGEETLKNLMSSYGSFDHNEQTIRVVTMLEKKYCDFDGLNLTFETLEGLVKHNGPYINNKIIPATVKELDNDFPLELCLFPSTEAQVANIADDIAYLTHDFDDGLREKLFSLDDLRDLKLPGLIIKKLEKEFPKINNYILIHQLIRFLISHFINDIISNSLLKLNKANFKSVNEIRLYHEPVITMTSKSIDYMEEIREFLFKNMYRNKKILNELSKASEMIEKLFFLYSKNINLLPKQWRVFNGNCLLDSPDNVRSRVIADYIAGMTDNFLRKEYKKNFKEE